MTTPEAPDALGEVVLEVEANVVAHLAGLEDAVNGLAERLESLGREGTSTTTAALTDLAAALTQVGRLVGPGFAEVGDRLTAIEQAQAERDERLAAVLSGFSEAISTALGRLGEQLGGTGGPLAETAP